MLLAAKNQGGVYLCWKGEPLPSINYQYSSLLFVVVDVVVWSIGQRRFWVAGIAHCLATIITTKSIGTVDDAIFPKVMNSVVLLFFP